MDKDLLEECLKDQPDSIKEMVKKTDPFKRYRLKTTGQHCDIYSYSEDGTVTITVNGHDSEALNLMNNLIQINVFGINPDDLEVIDTI